MSFPQRPDPLDGREYDHSLSSRPRVKHILNDTNSETLHQLTQKEQWEIPLALYSTVKEVYD
jgi:hypothetical protein